MKCAGWCSRKRQTVGRESRVQPEVVERARQRGHRRRPCRRRRASPARAVMVPMRVTATPRPAPHAATRSRPPARRGEAQLVVVAAGEQARERERALAPASLRRARRCAESRASSMRAPTPDASRMCARSPVSPSDTSSAAVAMPRRRLAERDARLGTLEPRAQAARASSRVERRASLHRGEREHRVAQRARHLHVVAGARAGARDRRARRHLADDRHAQVARTARRVAADQRDAEAIGEREQAARERREPALVGVAAARRRAAPSAAARPSPRCPTGSRRASCGRATRDRRRAGSAAPRPACRPRWRARTRARARPPRRRRRCPGAPRGRRTARVK